MKKIPDDLLIRMADQLAAEDRDEMAIPSYLHTNPLLRWMAWRRLEVLARRLDRVCQSRSEPSRVILDFGCGTGVLFDEALRHAKRVYGVDLVLDSARLLLEEWHLQHVTLFTPDEADNILGNHSIDIILAAEVLEHIEPLAPTLTRFASWLRPNGRLLISVPTENPLYRLGRRLAGFRGNYHHSNAKRIAREIERAGFERRWRATIPAPGPLGIYWILEYSPPVG